MKLLITLEMATNSRDQGHVRDTQRYLSGHLSERRKLPWRACRKELLVKCSGDRRMPGWGIGVGKGAILDTQYTEGARGSPGVRAAVLVVLRVEIACFKAATP